jgi:hypothetical protein
MTDNKEMTDMEALDEAIAEYVRRGWNVHQATLTGVQLKHAAGRSIYLTAAMAGRGEFPELDDSKWLAAAVAAQAAQGGERELVIEIPIEMETEEEEDGEAAPFAMPLPLLFILVAGGLSLFVLSPGLGLVSLVLFLIFIIPIYVRNLRTS